MTFRLRVALILLLLPAAVVAADAPRPLAGRVILVDPGHGVINIEGDIINGGKYTADDVPEHRLTLEIGEKLSDELSRLGAKTFQTRSDKHYWRQAYNSVDDNKSRSILAETIGADALISVHCDWHPNRRVRGITTLYENDQSKKLGESILKSLLRTVRPSNRGNRRDTFTVLDNTSVPAVIVETGFMSNAAESRKLKNPAYQKKLADGIAKGIVRYFKKYGSSSPQQSRRHDK